MRVNVDSFRGEAPRLTPRALPPNAAQVATNARLLTGDLEAWRQFATEQALANTGPVLTIYNLNGAWLSWDTDVDVARGAVAGDTSFRTFLTGPDEYTQPQWTNYAMATGGAEPFPFETRPLGVPGPDTPPTVAAGIDPNPTAFAVDVLDEGDSLATNWTKSPTSGGPYPMSYSSVDQSASIGNPLPSYYLQYSNNEGLPAYLYRNFGVANANALRMSVDLMFPSDSSFQGAQIHAMCPVSGAGIVVGVRNEFVAGPNGVLSIGIARSWAVGGSSALTAVALPALTAGAWHTVAINVVKNSDGTQTVTAEIALGSVTLASITATNTFELGDYCGFANDTAYDAVIDFRSFFDNILVQASGSTGYVPINTATNYVYTFVNDIGEESAPSFASTTVLRPDGVAITVTTPTDAPTGTDSEYGITTKRIYRAATGATGTFFRFVAEIPLATADYVDTLPDTELGEVLQSELWALPPTDMQGILALPNGVMAGFSKNQLCLSAQNHPHAWPVEYRLTVDTDIVAIGNIDTTVVIGTENFIYLAIGTDPAAYSMTKLEVPQACVSKRSLAYLIGIGVVFASPDGLIAVAGNGNVRNLTSSTFTRDQWQALAPESIVGVAHDDVYHFFYDNDEPVPPEESDVLNVNLVAESNGSFNGGDVNTWNGTALTASDYATWTEATNLVTITQAGVYEITCTTRLQGNYGLPDTHFKNYSTIFGHKVPYGLPENQTQHQTNGGGTGALGSNDFQYVQFTDKFTLIVTDAPSTFRPTTFAQSYFDSNSTFAAHMNVVVRRSGDYIG